LSNCCASHNSEVLQEVPRGKQAAESTRKPQGADVREIHPRTAFPSMPDGFNFKKFKCMCDIVMYNKKYVFGLCPCFWERAPKTLGISKVMRGIKVSFVM